MKLKVMSFNLRVRAKGDGINIFDNRRDRILETIKTEDPDLIGFQEATDVMKVWLNEVLCDTYVILGCGRGPEYRGETPCLAYKRELFELVSFNTFWLSDTPDVPGSRFEELDQSPFPRVTFEAKLSPVDYEGCISFVNTHLDHKGELARVAAMKMISERIGEGKFILTGDMNAFPDSECIALMKSVPGVCEVTENIPTTFHKYGEITYDYKIDYIFTNATPISSYAIEDSSVDGVYISDHYPVVAEIEI